LAFAIDQSGGKQRRFGHVATRPTGRSSDARKRRRYSAPSSGSGKSRRESTPPTCPMMDCRRPRLRAGTPIAFVVAAGGCSEGHGIRAADLRVLNPMQALPRDTERRWDIDALRGLMLVLMTLTHMPTRFSDPFGQPFGFVSAAEGFVMLSGFMAGMVYTKRQMRDGEVVMREAFLRRALKIYACQAALLLFLFTFIAVLGMLSGKDAVSNLLDFYLERPLAAFFSGLALLYSPPLLDILPMYILFMLLSPVLLLHGLQGRWRVILAVSVTLWLVAQFDVGRIVYETVMRLTGFPIAFRHTGAFDLMAWQFVWVLGLWMGASKTAEPASPPLRFPRSMVVGAAAIAAICFVWRHAVGQTPFPEQMGLNVLFDKWHVGPLRMVNFLALLLLTMHFAPWLASRLPRLQFLEAMGTASLPVFCAHLVLALLTLAVLGDRYDLRPAWIDAAVLAATFPVLYAVALASQAVDRRSAALHQRVKARRTARQPSTSPT
jgi:hypothetical protein